jgi:hypothetical protein
MACVQPPPPVPHSHLEKEEKKTSVHYAESSRASWTTEFDPVSKQTNKQTGNKGGKKEAKEFTEKC